MNASFKSICACTLVFGFGSMAARVLAQVSAGGTIEGRVVNSISGNHLENARVRVEGTSLQALTNSAGEYRIHNVPPGERTVIASFAEFAAKSKTVRVGAGDVVQQDYTLERTPASLGGETVLELDPFTVSGRILDAQSAAINEQRVSRIIKNVLAFEEFGDISGDGNPGEYLKYVPGVSMNYGPDIAQFASIRGMPPNGTLVTIDGSPLGSSSGDRQFELTGAGTGSIDRIEITKSPTPDMPANSIGGAINIVAKSGFSRSKPLFTYGLYTNFGHLTGRPGLTPSLGTKPSPDPDRMEVRPVQPGFDVSYLRPVNKSFAFTVSGGASNRYHYYDTINTTWDLTNLLLSNYVKTHVIVLSNRTLLGGTLDWRISKKDTVRATATHTKEDFRVAQPLINFAFGANATGGHDFVQGRAGAGTVSHGPSANNSYRDTEVYSLRYKHDGPIWTIDADASHSIGTRVTTDFADGFFSGITASYTGLTLRAEGIDQITGGALPRVTASNAGGTVNVFDGGNVAITAAAAAAGRTSSDKISGGRLNVEREVGRSVPVRIKAGLVRYRETLDLVATPRTWTFTPPGGPAGNTARNLGLTNPEFSASVPWHDVDGRRVPLTFVNAASLFQIYKEHPEYFTLNQAAAYTGRVNASKEMAETISAAYVMGDTRFVDNRLRVVGGVRFEETSDDGRGPKSDIGATFARDANGNILRNAAGAPIRITTDALQLAMLQLKEREAISRRKYHGYYPSLNVLFAVNDHLQARGAFARTIGRPAMAEILPGLVLPDPTSALRTITVNNTGLRPWTADSYDLTLEAYEMKSAVVSVGAFRKDITGFFASTTSVATAEQLADFGLPSEYLGYDLVTKRNGGSAQISGLEWSFRQNLTFLPGWARGFNVYMNGTHLRLSGPNAADFTQFSPRNLNWGIGFVRPTFSAKVNVNDVGQVRTTRIASSASIPENTYFYIAPQKLVDVTLEFRIKKWLTIYSSVRNATNSVKYTRAIAPGTPDFAKTRVTQRFGALYTLGVKGQF